MQSAPLVSPLPSALERLRAAAKTLRKGEKYPGIEEALARQRTVEIPLRTLFSAVAALSCALGLAVFAWRRHLRMKSLMKDGVSDSASHLMPEVNISIHVSDGSALAKLPDEWKQLFRTAGVSRKDLANPEIAKLVLQALAEEIGSMRQSELAMLPPPLKHSQRSSVSSIGGESWTTETSAQTESNGSGTPLKGDANMLGAGTRMTTSDTGSTQPLSLSPPPISSPPPPPPPPPPHAAAAPPPPPPPPPSAGPTPPHARRVEQGVPPSSGGHSSASGGLAETLAQIRSGQVVLKSRSETDGVNAGKPASAAGGLEAALAQIRKGAIRLKAVEQDPQKDEQHGKGSLADVLKAKMAERKKLIVGNSANEADEMEEADDWQ